MTERLLILRPNADGKVVLSSSARPTGTLLPASGAIALDQGMTLSGRGRRVRVPEWIVSATAAMLTALLNPEPPVEAVRWWKRVAEMSVADAEKMRSAHADRLRESTQEATRRAQPVQMSEADAAMMAYGELLSGLATVCASTLRSAAESCGDVLQQYKNDLREIAAAEKQLLDAAGAPLPSAAEHEWRARVNEVVQEETERSKKRARERAERAMLEMKTHGIPEVPAGIMKDPAAPFYSTPVLSAMVASHAKQVELHMLEKMRDAASECAEYLRTRPAFREDASE